MKEAKRVSGLKTKKAVVEAALQMLIRVQAPARMLDLAGKVEWVGNIDEMREGRSIVILVDSSVWIDYLTAASTSPVRRA